LIFANYSAREDYPLTAPYTRGDGELLWISE